MTFKGNICNGDGGWRQIGTIVLLASGHTQINSELQAQEETQVSKVW